MRTFILLAFCLTSFGCAVSINLPQEVVDQIPEKANRVDIYTNDMMADTFVKIKQYLTDHGYTITEENDLTNRVETNLLDVGQRTRLGVTLRVAPVDNGSKIEAIGTWSSDVEEATFATASQGMTSEDQDFWLANWGGSDRSKYAYAQLILLLDDYPSREVRYVEQR